jgi:hypothetical protein
MDFAARLAWNPEAFGPDAQPHFMREFAARTCGASHGEDVAGLMADYYQLGQIRKPEFMNREWAASLPDAEVRGLLARYEGLLRKEAEISRRIPERSQDAFFELFGYSAQMLAATGLVFLNDRLARIAMQDAAEHEQAVRHWRAFIKRQVAWYNDKLADGKWRHYATVGGTTLDARWAAVQWPWLEQEKRLPTPIPAPLLTLNAGDFSANQAVEHARWQEMSGLGWSNKAMALWPAVPENHWNPTTQLTSAPQMKYFLQLPSTSPDAELILYVLPTYELYPGMKLRIAVAWNDQTPQVLEVPFASSETRVVSNELRSEGVLNNRIALRMPLGEIPAGKHEVTVFAVDPGGILDQIAVTA